MRRKYHHIPRWGLAILASCLPLNLNAEGLEWKTFKQTFEAELGQEKVEAVYSFTNKSGQAVVISKVQASCGCTVPTLEKDRYESGESGEIKATFNIGQRVGHQIKHIQVYTDEADRRGPYDLTLTVDIPQAISFKTSRTMIWRGDDAAKTIECVVELHEKIPMQITSAKALRGNGTDVFDFEVVELEPKKKYALKVTPKSLDQSARVTFQLESPDDSKGVLIKYPIYAIVSARKG